MKQIPAKMKAFVVTEPKKWSVKEVDVPKPKYKEVLIEMETSGNLSYRLACKANYDWLVEPKYPLIPGHWRNWKGSCIRGRMHTFENWW
nr:hypothetical protein [Mycoplasmopsis bovis]